MTTILLVFPLQLTSLITLDDKHSQLRPFRLVSYVLATCKFNHSRYHSPIYYAWSYLRMHYLGDDGLHAQNDFSATLMSGARDCLSQLREHHVHLDYRNGAAVIVGRKTHNDGDVGNIDLQKTVHGAGTGDSRPHYYGNHSRCGASPLARPHTHIAVVVARAMIRVVIHLRPHCYANRGRRNRRAAENRNCLMTSIVVHRSRNCGDSFSERTDDNSKVYDPLIAHVD